MRNPLIFEGSATIHDVRNQLAIFPIKSDAARLGGILDWLFRFFLEIVLELLELHLICLSRQRLFDLLRGEGHKRRTQHHDVKAKDYFRGSEGAVTVARDGDQRHL